VLLYRRAFITFLLLQTAALPWDWAVGHPPDEKAIKKSYRQSTDGFAYQPSERHLIPEIVNLPAGGGVPQGVYTAYDTRSIGESIVEHVHRIKEHARRTPQPKYDFMRDSELQLYFQSSLIESVLSGGFLNQHVTGTSRMTLDPSLRANAEDQLAQLSIANGRWGKDLPENWVRPKYAILELNADRDLGVRTAGYSGSSYGEVIAVLKDEVKYRSTWTPEDSLNIRQGAGNTFFARDPEFVKIGDSTHYYEAQIWGELDLRDVKEFRVPKDFPEEKLKLLREAGLPVFEYELAHVHNRGRATRGKQVFGGDPGKMRRYAESLAEVRKNARNRKPPRPNLAIPDPEGTVPRKVLRATTYPTKIESFPASALREGARIQTPRGELYEVRGFSAENGRWELISDESFIAHLVLSPPPAVMRELAFQRSAHAELSKVGIRYLGVNEIGRNYAIQLTPRFQKTFREMEDLLLYQASAVGYQKEILGLKELFAALIKNGIAIEGLGPEHLVWKGDQWSLTGSFKLRKGLSPEAASKRFASELSGKKWGFWSAHATRSIALGMSSPLEEVRTRPLSVGERLVGANGEAYNVSEASHSAQTGKESYLLVNDRFEELSLDADATRSAGSRKDFNRRHAKEIASVEAFKRLTALGIDKEGAIGTGDGYLLSRLVPGRRENLGGILRDLRDDMNRSPWLPLRKIFSALIDQGIHLRGLTDENLQWDPYQLKWVLSGALQATTGLAPERARELYRAGFKDIFPPDVLPEAERALLDPGAGGSGRPAECVRPGVEGIRL
jgi:hypothetical protein